MSSGGSSPSKTTQTQKIDPWLKQQIEGNLQTIQGLQTYQPYSSNKAIAPINSQMQNVLNTQRSLGQQGVGLLGQGAQTLQGVAGYDPQQIALNQGLMPQQIGVQGQVDAVSAGQANLDPFFNPFQSQVVDRTLQGIDRSRQLATQRTDDQAIGAGAFGGSRHGVAEAETNRAYGDIAANTVAGLNQQGFNTALAAAQNQQGMNLQAGGMNQAAQQFNIGTDLAAQQANQQMQQNLLGADLAAQQANQSAGLDANRLNLLGGQSLLGAGQSMFGLGQQAAQYGQNYDQGIRDFNYQQYQQAFNDPRILAQLETAAIQGIPFMGSTATTQPGGGGNSFGSAIGSGLSGAALGASVGSVVPVIGTGMGAAVGGGLGLLGGMFG